jgi:hypothetical protein
VNLRPTSPLRTPNHVDDAIPLLLETGADSVKAVHLARQHPHKMWLRTDDGCIEPYLKTPMRLERGPDVPRAELDDVYWQNGMVDVTRRSVIFDQRVMIGRKVAGLVTEPSESIDIDTPLDLALCGCSRSAAGRPMKALVVGLGSIGRRHARNWVRLGLGEVLVCRQTDRPLPEPLGVPAREFRALDEALADQPDVVLVTNPTSLHLATARLALQAGSHVLVEKPISHTLDGTESLLHSERLVTVGYNLRFHPGLLRTRELLHAGAIGKPLSLRAEVGEYLPDWHPWEDYRQSYAARRDQGGGPILTFSHELDSVYWLLGMPVASRRHAHASALEIDLRTPPRSCHASAPRSRGLRAAAVRASSSRRRRRRVRGSSRPIAAALRAGDAQWITEEGDPRFGRNGMFAAELCSLPPACGRDHAGSAPTRTGASTSRSRRRAARQRKAAIVG